MDNGVGINLSTTASNPVALSSEVSEDELDRLKRLDEEKRDYVYLRLMGLSEHRARVVVANLHPDPKVKEWGRDDDEYRVIERKVLRHSVRSMQELLPQLQADLGGLSLILIKNMIIRLTNQGDELSKADKELLLTLLKLSLSVKVERLVKEKVKETKVTDSQEPSYEQRIIEMRREVSI